MTLTCFKPYDICGRLGDELRDEVAYPVGRAYVQHPISKAWLLMEMYDYPALRPTVLYTIA